MALGKYEGVRGYKGLSRNNVTDLYRWRPSGGTDRTPVNLKTTDLEEALALIPTLMREARTPSQIDKTTTLDQHWRNVLAYQQGPLVPQDERWDERTVEQYELRYRINLKPVLGKLPVAEIKVTDVIYALDQMKSPGYLNHKDEWTPYSGSAQRQAYMTLSVLFRYAAEPRFGPLRTDAPLLGVRIPKATKKNPLTADDILEVKDIEAIVRKASKREGQLFKLASLTGLRVSEVCGLQWGNYDASEGTLTLTHQLRRKRTADQQVKALKGKKDIVGSTARVIILSPEATVTLNAIRREATQTATNLSQLVGEAFIFATRSGMPLSQRNVSRELTRAAKEAGIEKPCGTHAFRHHYASRMFAAGAVIEEVQEDLGHSDPRTTQGSYVRIIPSDLRKARKAELYAQAGM